MLRKKNETAEHSTPQTHEYLVVEVKAAGSGSGEFRKQLQKDLDEHARHGWRVVSIAANAGPERVALRSHMFTLTVVLERPVSATS